MCGVGQGPTLAIVDAAAGPVRPAITWQDRRPGGGGFGLLPAMAWLAREEPAAVERARVAAGGLGRARAVAVGRGGDRAPGTRGGVG